MLRRVPNNRSFIVSDASDGRRLADANAPVPVRTLTVVIGALVKYHPRVCGVRRQNRVINHGARSFSFIPVAYSGFVLRTFPEVPYSNVSQTEGKPPSLKKTVKVENFFGVGWKQDSVSKFYDTHSIRLETLAG
jgi:hypothetical protein